MTETLPVDGRSLTLEQFLAVTRDGCSVSLPSESRHAVDASRRAVERAVKAARPVYGVTTGFGLLSDRSIAPEEAEKLQYSLLRSHASGQGPALAAEVVRGMLLLRLNSLARGHSGVRVELLERMIDLLNHHLVPYIPEQGSVGASGDLAPLAHMGLALIGEGEFLLPNGTRQPAKDVLEREGLPPIGLTAKEGVALINGTSLMTAYLALGVADDGELLSSAEVTAALSFDALEGNPESLDDRLGEVRNFPEQRAIAAAMRALLDGSELASARSPYRGQDPYTLRCIPQVLASSRLALDFARKIVEQELNAVSDNPVLFEGDDFISGGNFHGQNLALALDTLALGVQYLAGFAERRIARLVNPALNRGLPAFLAPTPGLSSGFMIPQYLAAALVNENGTLVYPASATSLPTSADQEDFVSMGPWAGVKLRRILENTRKVLAIEWMVAGQALELRRPKRGGRGSEMAVRALREFVESWSTDRSPARDLDTLVERLRDGTLLRRVRSAVPI
jgi:histidine ammonia-lyase